MSVLIIDNYDSFVYNLYQYIGSLGVHPFIRKNDKTTISDIKKLNPSHIIISPGPGNPDSKKYFGQCYQIIDSFYKKIPILGVCLGHQGIVSCFGGEILKAKTIMHGKTSKIVHNKQGIFHGIKSPLNGMRYHSLIIDPLSLPSCLEAIAQTEDGVIMGIKHKNYPLYGIQFHPESIGTEGGYNILDNFIKEK